MIMNNYGTITYEGKNYLLLSDAELTNRCFDGDYNHAEVGETYTFEMKADAVGEEDGIDVTVYWMFEEVKGEEKENLDEYDYSIASDIRFD